MTTLQTKSASSDNANSKLQREAATVAPEAASESRPLPWRAIGVIAIAVLTFMMTAMLALPPRYVTVDDSFLDCIAAGVAIASEPDSHLPFMNFLVGILLSTLYKLTDKVPFYPLFLLAEQYIANVVICGTIWTIYRSRVALVPIGLYLLSIALPVMTIFQFSTTSAIIGIAGGVISGTAFESDKGKRKVLIAAGVALFLCSILTRPRMGIIVIALFFIVMISKYAFVGNKKPIAVAILTALLFAIQLGLTAIDSAYYNTDNWAEFGKMRQSMNPTFDWGRANSPDNAAQLASAGWSTNDFKMMQRGLLFDVSDSCFDRLNRACQPYRGDFRTEVPRNLISIKNDALVSMLLILTVSCGLMVNLKQLGVRRIIALLVGTFSLLLAIAFFFKLSRHAYLPSFYTLAVVALTHLDIQLAKTIPLRGWSTIKSAALFAALLYCCITIHFYNVEIACARAGDLAEKRFLPILRYLRLHSDKIAFSLHATGILPPQIHSPFQTNDALRNITLVTSLSSHAPLGEEIMRARGVKDFASGLLSPNSVVLSDRRSNRLLRKYFKEHHSKEVRFTGLLVEQNSGLGVYKLAAAEHPTQQH